MSGLGDLLYDKDAVYININDHFVQFSKVDETAAVGGRRGKYFFSVSYKPIFLKNESHFFLKLVTLVYISTGILQQKCSSP